MAACLPLLGGMEASALSLGAAVSGAVLGNHAAPHSDTTILSAGAFGLSPLEHAVHQSGWVLLAGLASLLGFAWLGLQGIGKKERPHEHQTLVPPGQEALYGQFGYVPAVVRDGVVHVSGQLGNLPDGSIPENPRAQYLQAFENVKSVLALAGSDVSRIIKSTSFHVGLQAHMPVLMAARTEAGIPINIAWTDVGVSELAPPGAIVEIEVIAEV